MKPFYIVPNSRNYYDTVNADSAADALVGFTENMDSDMSAYFSAVEEEPAQYPHGYKYPEGKFQLSMSIIMDTMSGDKKAPYYIEGALENVDISRMDVVEKLQESYETLQKMSSPAAYDVRGRYYKLLRDITGFALDKKKKPDPEDLMRVRFAWASNEDRRRACNALDKENVPYDTDGSGRLLIKRRYMKEASKILDNEGINADIVSA